MATIANKTVKEFLVDLAASNTSTETDDKWMQVLLKKCGFTKAIVTCGIAYLEGKGTIECPPMSIHMMAQEILNIRKIDGRRNK